MGNTNTRAGESVVEAYSAYDEINRGTVNRPRPLLKFHTVHGENVELLQDGRIARRKDSFCKGLVFSNRPIGVDEIVCLRLCEVGTNWSGVLRFGVSNVDPASFRDIELPKFACPDLTSKSGYWAKALAERYSMDKAILHFFVNSSGELYYGINGINKGLFLNGINVSLPLWIIIDIYGNSVGVEFLDPADVNLRSIKSLRNKHSTASAAPAVAERPCSIVDTSDLYNNSGASTPVSGFVAVNESSARKSMSSSTSATNLLQALNTTSAGNNTHQFSSARTSPSTQQSASSRLRFHTVKGVNISLDGDDLIATRRHGEYYLGYVFTERPIRIDEKLCIVIKQTEDAFTGSMSFGLTSCDPTTMPASRLPIDNDELLERPEYWVCIKDVAAQPVTGDRLTFFVDCAGQVHFAKNDAPPRVIMHVDVSVNLWAFFDLYGTTRKIQLIDCQTLSTVNTAAVDNLRNYRASSEGSSSIYHHHQEPPASSSSRQPCNSRPATTSVFNLDGLRVALPPPESSSSVDNLNDGGEAEIVTTTRVTSSRGSGSSPSIPIPSTATGDVGERSSRHSSGGSGGGLTTAHRGGVTPTTSTNAPTFFNISPTPSASSSSAPLSAATAATMAAGGNGTLDPDLWSFRSSLLRRLQQSSVNDLHSASSAPSMCQNNGGRSAGSGSHYNSGGSHYHNHHHHHSQLSSSPHDAASSPFDTSRYMSLLSSSGSAAAARRRMSASPRSERRDISGDSTATAAVTTPSPLATTPTHSSSVAASAAATVATVANFRNTLSEAMESALSNTGSGGYTPWTPSTTTTSSSNTSPFFSTFATTVPSSSISSNSGVISSSTTITPMSRRSKVAAASAINTSSTRTWEQQLKAQKSLEDPSDGSGGAGSECSICMNSRVNAVIYRCGHMCMCFTCAKETHRRSGDCPICRTPIIDVIRCYPA